MEMMLLFEQNEASATVDTDTDTPDNTADSGVSMPNIFGLTGMTELPETQPPQTANTNVQESSMTESIEPVAKESDTEPIQAANPIEKADLAGMPGYDENGVLIPIPKFINGTQPEQFLAACLNGTILPTETSYSDTAISYSGTGHITKSGGVFYGPSGKETYYNLPMNGVVKIMRRMGYSEEEYPYWVREDGAKMLGDYIMVAAHLGLRPRGTILETSLGTAMVCDTGAFAIKNPTQLDLALDW